MSAVVLALLSPAIAFRLKTPGLARGTDRANSGGPPRERVCYRTAKYPLLSDLDTLRKHFTLTTEDLEEVEQCRGAINKLGFAVQLCTLRWQGYFLRDTCGVPEMALEIVASQLGLLAIPIEDYPQNEKTR